MASVEKEKKAWAVIEQLRRAGFTGYLAGGCVRDRILGVAAKDYDIATDARPEELQRLFEHTVAVGARFGVIMVILDGDQFEVATFRSDDVYIDGRRPSAIHFGTIEEDVQRRDFTIGGMYFDPVANRVIDLVGGLRDLRAGVIRAIGNPQERFREDHLRLLRAIRFAARFNFTIEPATWAAIQGEAASIANIAAERVGEEIVMIMTEGRAARGLDLLVDSGLAAAIMPEVLALKGCEQPANYHPEGDVYRHTRLMLSMLSRGCSETVAFGTLLHDIAKPRCRAVTPEGKTTYYGHTEQGAEMGADLMRRLRRSRFVQERVAYLVRYHLRLCMAPRMRPATLKRMLAEEGFGELLELARLDALGSNSYLGFYHFCRQARAGMTMAEMRPPRILGGDDLIKIGFKPGPAFKRILAEIEDLHLDGALATRDDALRYVAEHYPPPADG
ncbi:MAG: CCA tRNA nucleotidyltransferase [Candidatus Binataceae bacterium]|jgi:poly(A) polymerase